MTDGTKAAQFIFFTPKADEFIGINCRDLVASAHTLEPGQFPADIEAIVGTKHTIQFHYNPTCTIPFIEFFMDEVFGIPDVPKHIEKN